MSRNLTDLLDAATVEAALSELGLTEPEFWALDADRFQAVIDAHGKRVEAWNLREQERIDQARAKWDRLEGVPEGMAVWHAGQEGFVDPGAAQDALYSVFLLQQAEETDPQPAVEAVAALLNAVFGLTGGSAEA